MKIIVTGGHPTPAMAVIDEIHTRQGNEILFVGKKYHYRPEEASFEFSEIKKREIPFIHFNSGRFSRIYSPLIFWEGIKALVAIFRALSLLKKEKPDIIMSFGGYIALPIALAGRMLNIPIFTHEQTIAPGTANRYISKIARTIFISFPQTQIYFNPKKTVYSGLPLRKQLFEQKQELIKRNNKPLLFILGGSLGSHSLNMHIERIITSLAEHFQIIHQVGNISEFGDYTRLKNLTINDYYLFEHITDAHIGWVFAEVDVVVSRAGANTVMELIALKKPAVLVPLPWSAGQEQLKQARLLASAGVAEIFDQTEHSDKLEKLIQKIYDNRNEYKKNFTSIQEKLYRPDAAKVIVDHMLS